MIFRRPRGAGYEHSQPRPDPPARHEPDNGPQEPATGGDTGPPERRQPVATTIKIQNGAQHSVTRYQRIRVRPGHDRWTIIF